MFVHILYVSLYTGQQHISSSGEYFILRMLVYVAIGVSYVAGVNER